MGKLASTGLVSLYNFLAIIPVLSILLLFGSLNAGDLFRCALALLNTLFFSHAIALLISTFHSETQKAVNQACVLLYLLIFMTPHLENLSMSKGGELWRLLAWLSPSYAFNHATTFFSASKTTGPPPAFWLSLALSHLTAWLFLALASWLVRDCWRERAIQPWRLRWREWRQHWLFGDSSFRATRRKAMLPIHPYFWLINRQRFSGLPLWLLLGFLLILGIGLSLLAHDGQWSPQGGELLFAACSLQVILKLHVASVLSNTFCQQDLSLSSQVEIRRNATAFRRRCFRR